MTNQAAIAQAASALVAAIDTPDDLLYASRCLQSAFGERHDTRQPQAQLWPIAAITFARFSLMLRREYGRHLTPAPVSVVPIRVVAS